MRRRDGWSKWDKNLTVKVSDGNFVIHYSIVFILVYTLNFYNKNVKNDKMLIWGGPKPPQNLFIKNCVF